MDDIRTRALKQSWDGPGGCPSIGQVVSGVEGTRAQSGCFRMERERACPDTVIQGMGGERECLKRMKPRGIEYRCVGAQSD